MEHTKNFLLEQCALYPALHPQDLLKALHQSVFGCGHFVTDEAAGLSFLHQELKSPGPAAEIELLDGNYCRLPLGYLSVSGLSSETLFRLFVLSAEGPTDSTVLLQKKLDVLLHLSKEGLLPFFTSPYKVN